MNSLEQAAVDAHEAGILWQDFIAEHGPGIEAAHHGNRDTQRRLTAKLLALVVCGDTGGLYPLDTAWERPAEWEMETA